MMIFFFFFFLFSFWDGIWGEEDKMMVFSLVEDL